MIQTLAKIISNDQIAEGHWRMAFIAPQIASEIEPGQFVHIKLSQNNYPLLRRPFSVVRRLELSSGEIGVEVIYRVVGRGTNFMTTLKPGDNLDVIGPLGHGFKIQTDKRAHLLLGGGVGAAGLFMLGQELSKGVVGAGLELNILLGATTKKSLVLEREYQALNGKIMVSTDDGSYGYRGYVSDMLKEALETKQLSSNCAIYACGPEPMYKALSSICQKYGISAQVSMEKHMLCGIGVCLACICEVDRIGVSRHRDIETTRMQFTEDGTAGYALVCKDGPVFNIDEVKLND